MIVLKFFPTYKIMIDEAIHFIGQKTVFQEYFPDNLDSKTKRSIRQKLVYLKNMPITI
jgi:hypothetical protein